MTRAEKRALKNRIRNDIKEFLKIQAHYFPDLIHDIKKIMDARNHSYITYEIEVIIFAMILKNICSIESMQEMNEVFNEDTCVKKIYKVLGLEEKTIYYHQVLEAKLVLGEGMVISLATEFIENSRER